MKILLLAACLITLDTDKGGVHHDEGAIVDAPKETARQLVGYNRALYVSRTDDPDKGGRNTASKEMLEAADALAAEREAQAKAAAKAPRQRKTADSGATGATGPTGAAEGTGATGTDPSDATA